MAADQPTMSTATTLSEPDLFAEARPGGGNSNGKAGTNGRNGSGAANGKTSRPRNGKSQGKAGDSGTATGAGRETKGGTVGK